MKSALPGNWRDRFPRDFKQELREADRLGLPTHRTLDLAGVALGTRIVEGATSKLAVVELIRRIEVGGWKILEQDASCDGFLLSTLLGVRRTVFGKKADPSVLTLVAEMTKEQRAVIHDVLTEAYESGIADEKLIELSSIWKPSQSSS